MWAFLHPLCLARQSYPTLFCGWYWRALLISFLLSHPKTFPRLRVIALSALDVKIGIIFILPAQLAQGCYGHRSLLVVSLSCTRQDRLLPCSDLITRSRLSHPSKNSDSCSQTRCPQLRLSFLSRALHLKGPFLNILS